VLLVLVLLSIPTVASAQQVRRGDAFEEFVYCKNTGQQTLYGVRVETSHPWVTPPLTRSGRSYATTWETAIYPDSLPPEWTGRANVRILVPLDAPLGPTTISFTCVAGLGGEAVVFDSTQVGVEVVENPPLGSWIFEWVAWGAPAAAIGGLTFAVLYWMIRRFVPSGGSRNQTTASTAQSVTYALLIQKVSTLCLGEAIQG